MKRGLPQGSVRRAFPMRGVLTALGRVRPDAERCCQKTGVAGTVIPGGDWELKRPSSPRRWREVVIVRYGVSSPPVDRPFPRYMEPLDTQEEESWVWAVENGRNDRRAGTAYIACSLRSDAAPTRSAVRESSDTNSWPLIGSSTHVTPRMNAGAAAGSNRNQPATSEASTPIIADTTPSGKNRLPSISRSNCIIAPAPIASSWVFGNSRPSVYTDDRCRAETAPDCNLLQKNALGVI